MPAAKLKDHEAGSDSGRDNLKGRCQGTGLGECHATTLTGIDSRVARKMCPLSDFSESNPFAT